MSKTSIACSAAAVGFAALLSLGGAQAAMAPAVNGAAPNLYKADCAVGFHLGPAGACIIGTPDHVEHERVIERRATDDNCRTRSVTRSDSQGNTETRTASNCD